MADAPQYCIAKRGTSRFKAQCNVLQKYFATLCSESVVEREEGLSGFRNLRKTFLHLKQVLINGRSMLLLEHLLQCARTYTSETHESVEIFRLNRRLRWIEGKLSTKTAKQRRLRQRLHTECHRLDVHFVFRIRLENALDIESKWEQHLADKEYEELAEDILWAAEEDANRHIRTAALRWITEQRQLLPTHICNCKKLLEVLRLIPVENRSPSERTWAGAALVVSLDFEKIYSPDKLWLESKALYEELVAGEEMRGHECEDARAFFTV